MSDATAGRGGVGIRLFTTGGEAVKRTFDQVGDSGKRMWAEIATGQRTAHPALSALNTGAVQAKAGIGSLANQAAGGMSALAAFGTVGVAAAAALGAVAIASANFKETLTWAADLNDAADKIGVTAEALQNLHYAADETGVPLEALDAALQKLNGSLGAMQTGLGSGKVKAAFKELAIGPEDLKGMQNASDLLPLIADRISEVDTVASRVQILKKLQIAELEPLLRGGSLELARFTGEAATLGSTLSNEVVDGLDDTERKLERNKQQIDANVRAMQANLSPFFLWCSDWLAKLARGFTDMLDRANKVQDRNDRNLAMRAGQLQDDVTRYYRQSVRTGKPLQPWQQGNLDELNSVKAEIASRARDRIATSGPSAAAAALNDPPEEPDAPAHRTRSSGTSAASNARDTARQQAEADRAKSALDREEQRAQRERIQLLYGGDTPAERAKLADELAGLDRQERDASRTVLRSDLIKAGRSAEAADLEMKALRDLDAQAEALAQQSRTQVARADLAATQLQTDQAAADGVIALLEIQGQLATTERERTQIARQILATQQDIERKALAEKLGRDGQIDATDQRQINLQTGIHAGQISVLNASEEARIRETFKAAGRDVVQAIHDGRLGEYIGDQLKAKLLDGALNALFNLGKPSVDGATSAVSTGWKLAKSLFGFADGGYISGPGGPRDDHIPALLSNGEYVVNAAATRRMRPVLDRINNGGMERFALGGLAGPAEIGSEEAFSL